MGQAAARTIVLCTILLLMLGGCASAPLGTLEDAIWKAERQLDRQERRGLAGQILLVQGDRTLLSRGLGTLTPTSDQRVTMDSVMPLASVTKPFTASAVLALAADGRLDLNDALAVHLPELSENWQAVTIAQVLTHTAGLPAEIVNLAWDGYPRFEPISRGELIRRINRFEPDSRPGERFRYSNIGYNLAALLIQAASGQSPESYLAERLLAPSGITDLGLAIPEWSAKDMVIGRDGRQAAEHHFSQPRVDQGMGWLSRGSSDLLARPAAVTAWWRSLRAARWLPSPWLQAFLSPQVGGWEEDRYGFGLEFRRDRHGRAVGHTGGDLDFTVDWSWYPDLDLMVYVALADRRWRADQVRNGLLDELMAFL